MTDPASRLKTALAALEGHYPSDIELSLGRIQQLMESLGNPHRHLPPVIHVAGTNGKGSTCAFLRAMAEAAGLKVHVFTSPHLVRFNERVRLAGELISDDAFADALERVRAALGTGQITHFEATTAAALLAFSETQADLLILEVGLGGKYDATNIIPAPAVAVICPVEAGSSTSRFGSSPCSKMSRSRPGGPPRRSNTATRLVPGISGSAWRQARTISGVRVVRSSDAVSWTSMLATLRPRLLPDWPSVATPLRAISRVANSRC